MLYQIWNHHVIMFFMSSHKPDKATVLAFMKVCQPVQHESCTGITTDGIVSFRLHRLACLHKGREVAVAIERSRQTDNPICEFDVA